MSANRSWVDEIHSRLLIRYGRAWTDLYAGVSPELVKADWAQQLENMPAHRISFALQNLPNDRPTNAAQFRALCLSAPDKGDVLRVTYREKADPEVVQAAMSALNRSGARDDGKNWARRLRLREQRGDALTQVQRASWRGALATVGEYQDQAGNGCD